MSIPADGNPYVLSAGEGDERWFLGAHLALKTTGAQTKGGLMIGEVWGPRGHCSPLHIHNREDELFYMIEGEMRLEVDGQSHTISDGMMGFGPRGVQHRFTVTSDEARFLILCTPAGFEDFVREVSEPAADRRLPDPAEPDMDALMARAAANQMDIIGPPLEID